MVHATVSAITAVIHPELWEMGRAVWMEQQSQGNYGAEPNLSRVMQAWRSVYPAISAIANRECPMHRDWQTMSAWYDVLVSTGEYTGCAMELSTLGVRLRNDPGTITAFSGRLVRHGVSRSNGWRVVYAYYMRTAVSEHFGVPSASWAIHEMYNNGKSAAD